LSQARWGVLGLFFIMGVLLSTFLSRVPSITEALQVTTGRFAVLMLTGAIGAFLALLVTGWAVARFGTRSILVWSSFSYLVSFAVMAWALAEGNQWAFAAGQFFVSFSFAFTNVPMNAEAANVERWVGRAIMPHFHASFSVGMAAGLAFGAIVSHAGVSPTVHFMVVAVTLTVARLWLIRPAVVHGHPAEEVPRGIGGPFKTARDEYRDRRVILIGLIVFAASTIEGSAATWSSLAIVDSFGVSEAFGDIFYWVFLVAMVTTRGFGAQIIGRLGRVVSLRVSAVLVVLGVVMFAFGPVFAIVGVGMILWGLGAGLGVPIGFSAASDEPRRAAARVAAVSSFATIAGLVMPQIIGHLGDVVELRKALMVVSGAAVMSFLLARAVRAEGPLLRSHKAMARKERLAAEAAVDEVSVVVADGVEPMQAAPDEAERHQGKA
jgi:hypothetical protein